MIVPILMGAAVIVGVLWTCLIGGYLHWLPVLAAIVVTLILRKNMKD